MIQTCSLEDCPTSPLEAVGLVLHKASSRGRCLLTHAGPQSQTVLYPGDRPGTPATALASFFGLYSCKQVSPGQFLQLIIDVMIEGLFLLSSD